MFLSRQKDAYGKRKKFTGTIRTVLICKDIDVLKQNRFGTKARHRRTAEILKTESLELPAKDFGQKPGLSSGKRRVDSVVKVILGKRTRIPFARLPEEERRKYLPVLRQRKARQQGSNVSLLEALHDKVE